MKQNVVVIALERESLRLSESAQTFPLARNALLSQRDSRRAETLALDAQNSRGLLDERRHSNASCHVSLGLI